MPLKNAKLSIMTNALHYGTGIFGGIKIFETDEGLAIFRLDDHLKRLEAGVKALDFNFKVDRTKLKKIIMSLAAKNQVKGTVYVRPLIYRSDTDLSPDIAGNYDIAIYILHMPYYFDPSKGLKVSVSSWRRNPSDSIPPRTKATGGYINSALAIHEAHKRGFDSAIMLDKNGYVSEGAVMNIFIVKNSKLITPPLDSDILEGITRKTVIEMARALNIDVTERQINEQELYQADEVFFSGTAAEITWCNTIESVEISSEAGPITKRLNLQFKSLASSRPDLFTPLKG